MVLRDPVFIHGWAFSSKVFEGFKGIKVDLPGHGKNKEPYRGFRRMAEEVALSLPSRHDIVGWSLGGSVALLLAFLFPSKVRRLFLIGTTPHFSRVWSEANIRAFKIMVKREGFKPFREMALGEPFEDSVDKETALRLLEDYVSLDLTPLVPLLKVETYVIHGSKDKVVPVGEAFRLRSMLKRSKLIILPGGHLPVRDEGSFVSQVFEVR